MKHEIIIENRLKKWIHDIVRIDRERKGKSEMSHSCH